MGRARTALSRRLRRVAPGRSALGARRSVVRIRAAARPLPPDGGDARCSSAPGRDRRPRPRWRAAAATWDELGRPYPAAFAGWRQAEARLARGDRSSGSGLLLGRCHRTAATLGAVPLRAAIEDLARRARIDLTDGPPAAD